MSLDSVMRPARRSLDGPCKSQSVPGSLYISGDTVWYEGVAEVARRFSPRLVILFTGSAEPRGRFHMTMDSNDAIVAAHAFPGADIVAIHNHGVPISRKATPTSPTPSPPSAWAIA